MKKFNRLLCYILIIALVVTQSFSMASVISFADSVTETKESKPIVTEIKHDKKNQNYDSRATTEIIVKYKDESKKAATNVKVSTKLKVNLKTNRILTNKKINIVEVADNTNVKALVEELLKDPNVSYAQPNYPLTIHSSPTDSSYSFQWGLKNSGQEIVGKTPRSGVDVNVENAWNLTKGENSVVVGVLDTGIDFNHPDLANSIFVNALEIPNNGLDDDQNGYIDDVNGWDFAGDDNSVFDSTELDVHGTYIAGVLAASENESGIVGIAPNIKVLPLKFINGSTGYTSDAIEAIEYAMSQGVKIINCSFGSTENNIALKDTMQNSGILFIASAGNNGSDLNEAPNYPASFDLPNIISVAAIDTMGVLPTFSNFGTSVDIAAPGTNILSTSTNNSYDYFSGTSVAAPFVTGAAALILSNQPNATITTIKDQILSNARPCLALKPFVQTGGRLDVFGALTGTKGSLDDYNGPNAGDDVLMADAEDNGDEWHTQSQLLKIKEKIHYGESGINPASGNYSFTATDLSVISPGFQVNISRTYNSKDERTSAFGRGWTFGFEGSVTGTNNVEVKLPSGGTHRFNYDGLVYNPEDTRAKFKRNADGTSVLTTKDQYTYTFNTLGFLTAMTDENGNSVHITVDSNGKVQQITDTVGRTYTVQYNPNGLIERVTDTLNRTVKYEYNANNLLVKVIDPANNAMNYEYDAQGYLINIKDNDLRTIQTVTYNHVSGDAQHKVVNAIDSNGANWSYVYNMVEKKTTITDVNGRVWTYFFDASMYTVKIQDPEGDVDVTEYYAPNGKNVFGDVTKKIDKYGNTTLFDLDAQGNITKITYPDQGIESLFYDSKNHLVKKINAIGVETHYIYDSQNINKIKEVTVRKNAVYSEQGMNSADYTETLITYYTKSEANTLFGCNVSGLIKSTKNPLGGYINYTYDRWGNIATLTDERGNVTTYEYNSIGWKTAEISPSLFRTEIDYNNNGQMIRTKRPDSGVLRVIYDTNGRVVQEVNPNQYSLAADLSNDNYTDSTGTKYLYNEKGNLVQLTFADGGTVSYAYDVYGNLISEKSTNGSVRLFEYDNIDRLIKVRFKDNETSPAVTLFEYSYGKLSNGNYQKTEVKHLNQDESATTVTVYDFAGRLVETQYPNGSKSKTEYNLDGTVSKQVATNGAVSTFVYDDFGRLYQSYKPVSVENGGTKYSFTEYNYDKVGNKVAEKQGKALVSLGEVPSACSISYFEYNNDSTLSRTYKPDGSETTYLYDGEGNVSQEKVKLNTEEFRITNFEYDFDGKLLEEALVVDPSDFYGVISDGVLKTTYTYDKNRNLKSKQSPAGLITTYNYDVMDRMVSLSYPGVDEFGTAVTISESSTFDTSGNLLTKVDSKNNTTTYEYDSSNRCIKTTDPLGGVTLVSYDIGGRKVIEVQPNNYDSLKTIDQMTRTIYKYGSMNQILAVTLKYEALTYNESTKDWEKSWKETITKAFKYDNSLNVIKELSGEGITAAEGSTLDEKINKGYGTETSYNLANQPISIRDASTKAAGLPATVRFSYDGKGMKISETDSENNVIAYFYDEDGNLIRTELNGIMQKSQDFDFGNRMVKSIDANNNETAYEYNSFDKVRKIVYPSDLTIPSNTVNFKYDQMLNIVKEENTLGKVTLTVYDNQSRPVSITVRDGEGNTLQSKINKYDSLGNLRFETDSNGNETETTFDALNKPLTKSIEVDGTVKTTSYKYDANGNLTETTNWIGNKSINIYDAINRLVGVVDSYGVITEKLFYNEDNLQTKSVDALGRETVYGYDLNGRKVSKKDGEGNLSKTEYDLEGNVIAETDGLGNKTRFDYDALDRLTTVTNALGEKTTYTYDAAGNLLSQTDGKGNTTTFEYNVVNKVVLKADPVNGGESAKVERYIYYADGTLKSKLDRNGKTTNYSYDATGRLKSQTIGSESVVYTYDGNGNILTMTDQTGTTTWTYDELGRALTKTVPVIGTTTFEYDIVQGLGGLSAGGFAERTLDPKGNETIKYFDKAERLSAVDDGEEMTTFTYYDNGMRQSVVYPDGSSETYVYNKNNQNTSLINKKANGTVIDAYSYAYNAANLQISKTDSKGTTAFTYDKLGRISTITEPSGVVTKYSYDKAGNRTTESKYTSDTLTQETKYTYDKSDRLLRTDTKWLSLQTTRTVAFTYDANGNMLTRKTTEQKPEDPQNTAFFVLEKSSGGPNTLTQYAYNGFNQLKATNDGISTVTYAYDGNGSRVEKTVTTGPKASPEVKTTRYFYEKDKVILEVDGNGTEIAKNTYGTNLLSREMAGIAVYYMYNGHGDVTALLSTDGTQVASYYYDIWGNLQEKTESEQIRNPYRYSGYQFDEETGLYYLNARYYDSSIARFITEDTYTGQKNDPLSLNQYTYCHNDPIRYDDPTGQWAHLAIGAFIGGAISASVDLMTQVVVEKKSLKEVNWTSVKVSAGEGAIAGAIGAATGGASLLTSAAKSVGKTILKNVAVDAGVSFTSNVVSQKVVTGKVNLAQATSTAAMSALSFVGGTAGKKVVAAIKDTNAVKAVVSTVKSVTTSTKAIANTASTAIDKAKTAVVDKVSTIKVNVGNTISNKAQNTAIIKNFDLELFGQSKSAVTSAYKGGTATIKKGEHTVYTLRDPITDDIKYVGRTKNPTSREAAHKLTEGKESLVFTPEKTGLSYEQARGAEQMLFDANGKLENLLNKIRPISTKNPNYDKYMNAAQDVFK